MLALLGLYAVLELGLVVWVMRRPERVALVLIVLLPVHTLSMVLIFHLFAPSKAELDAVQAWKDILIITSLVAAILRSSGRTNQRLEWMDVAVLSLVAVALLSIPLHPELATTDQLLAYRTDYLFGPLYLLGRLSASTHDSRLRLLRVMAAVGILAAAVGVTEHFVNPIPLLEAIGLPGYYEFNSHLTFQSAGGMPYVYFTGDGARRAGSFFLSASDLAESCAVTLAAAAALYLHHPSHRRLAVGAGIAALLSAVVAAGRLELLVIPVLAICAAAGSRRFSRVASTAVAVALALSAVLILQLSSGFVTLSDASAFGHISSINTALTAVAQYPAIGAGLGNSGLAGARAGLGGGEGQLLVTAHDLGAPALLLALAIVLGGMIASFRRLQLPTDGFATASLMMMTAIALTFPIAEILSNLFVVSAAFWTLGQVMRYRVSSPSSIGNT